VPGRLVGGSVDAAEGRDTGHGQHATDSPRGPAVSAPAVYTERLTKRFGTVTAVDTLDLLVERGEVFGYLGPNGAGKTTTIRMLLDFVRPTAGRCGLLGGSGADPAIRRRIGYLPADLDVDPRWSARELLDFYGALRGGLDRSWVAELLRRFDLDPERPVGELSTGNRRKVGIVQAVAHRPELLILDEPTSGLDPLLQHEFQVLVRELVSDGATVFLSSHVLPEVEQLADRVAILRNGRLVALSTVSELRRTARSRIDLRLAAPVTPADLAVFDGIAQATAADTTIRLVVDGPVDAVVKAAARLSVQAITSYEADLEEVFLTYYTGPADTPRSAAVTA
jgi:ABC-2 type transport system ATP-binding protein